MSSLNSVKATFFFGGEGIKVDTWRYRPFQALNSYDYPSIAIKNFFLLGRRCPTHESGWGKEPTNAYLSLFIKLKFPTHPETTSISFIFPHCLPHIVTFAAEYGRLWIQRITVIQEETEICSRLMFSWFLTPANKTNHAVSLNGRWDFSTSVCY